MDDHSCCSINADITFTSDGVPTHRFRRMCDGTYWGGETLAFGPALPHQMVALDWMLRRVAELANDQKPASYHELAGHGWRTTIAKRMEADRIAGPLGCTEDAVRRFFSLSVEVPIPPLSD
jgi:hypothetical protein